MPEKAAFLTFVVAAFMLNIAPGPDMLYVIGRSVGQGRKAGIVSPQSAHCPAAEMVYRHGFHRPGIAAGGAEKVAAKMKKSTRKLPACPVS